MSQEDIGRLVEAGFSKMGLHGGALVLLGASAALPHGTLQPQKLKQGDVVLIDGGCAVAGGNEAAAKTQARRCRVDRRRMRGGRLSIGCDAHGSFRQAIGKSGTR